MLMTIRWSVFDGHQGRAPSICNLDPTFGDLAGTIREINECTTFAVVYAGI